MGQRKVNALDSTTDDNVANNTWLTVKTDPATGKSYKSGVSQEKKAYSPFKKKYVATGSEGTTLTITELAGKEILIASREAGIIYEVITPTVPDSTEFTFDGTNITLGLAVTGAGERFQFIFKTPS